MKKLSEGLEPLSTTIVKKNITSRLNIDNVKLKQSPSPIVKSQPRKTKLTNSNSMSLDLSKEQ